MNTEARPPLPPFTHETALIKVQKAEKPGTAATRRVVLRPAPPTRCGATRS